MLIKRRSCLSQVQGHLTGKNVNFSHLNSYIKKLRKRFRERRSLMEYYQNVNYHIHNRKKSIENLKRLKTDLSYDPVTPMLEMYISCGNEIRTLKRCPCAGSLATQFTIGYRINLNVHQQERGTEEMQHVFIIEYCLVI